MSENAPIYGTDCHYCDEMERDCGRHGPSPWIPADKELPGNPRCVLATDGECHFIAVYEGEGVLANCDITTGHKWSEAYSGDEIDSAITHWMELPEVPNE